MEILQDRIDTAMGLIERYGGIDGEHHKQWLLDQIVRVLKTDRYEQWVAEMCNGKDGPGAYDWGTGVAP